MNLYTADLHFGHSNIIKYDKRPFANTDEMDRVMIEIWNSRVSPEDDVYILGDFAYKSDKDGTWYLQRLRGHKHLVIGNHDGKLLANDKAMSYFETVDKMMYHKDEDKHICLCHFPIVEWNGYYRGTWHIYGHIHCRQNEAFQIMKTREKALNAGCMINNYMPVSFGELVKNNEAFEKSLFGIVV